MLRGRQLLSRFTLSALLVATATGCGGGDSAPTKARHAAELSGAVMADAMVRAFEQAAPRGFGPVRVTCRRPKASYFVCTAYHVVTNQGGRDLASVTSYSVLVDPAGEHPSWRAITSQPTELPARLRGSAADQALSG